MAVISFVKPPSVHLHSSSPCVGRALEFEIEVESEEADDRVMVIWTENGVPRQQVLVSGRHRFPAEPGVVEIQSATSAKSGDAVSSKNGRAVLQYKPQSSVKIVDYR